MTIAAATPSPAPKLAARHDEVLRKHRINPFPQYGIDQAKEVARLAKEAIALGALRNDKESLVLEETVDALVEAIQDDRSDGLGDIDNARLRDLETFLGERANVLHAVLANRDHEKVLRAEITIWLLTTADGEAVMTRARESLRGTED